MCYTIKIDLTREELERRFGAIFPESESFNTGDRIKAFSLPRLPVICSDNPGEFRIYTWGLIPYWIRDFKSAAEIRTKTFNAKAETLGEKPSFRRSYNRMRCIVPVNGFYEWQTLENQKIPYYITLKNKPVIALAGLYDHWTNHDSGEIMCTFTVITTRANPMMEEIHNLKKRMPVILSPENEASWLDLSTDPLIAGLFEPYPQELMQAEKLK
jgi:putative SOS response-associated peptidase YedK